MSLADFAVWVIQVLLLMALMLWLDFRQRQYIRQAVFDEVHRHLLFRTGGADERRRR